MARKVRKVTKAKTKKQGEGQRHEDELQAIKEKDPDFYRFLVEEDQQLLDFTADMEAESEDEKVEIDEKAEKAPKEKSRLLTLERFEQIRSSATKSFTAFKAVINAYHLAVRSISSEEREDAVKGDVEDDAVRPKRSNRRRWQSMTIDSEATFSAILEWCLANFLGLLEHHSGSKAEDSATVDPTRLPRWNRVKMVSQFFWDETLALLSHAQTAEMQEAVLRTCSDARALAWLWPFKALQRRYLRACLHIWTQPKPSSASTSSVSPRLLSFLFLRNAAAMTLLRDGLTLEALLRSVLRAFMAATASYSWRSLNSVRFMENCILELFRLDDAAAYRVGYVCIRQLALLLRNTSLSSKTLNTGGKVKAKIAQGKSNKAKASSKASSLANGKPQQHAKVASKKGKSAAKQSETLVSWPFVRAMFLWARLVSDLKALKDLAYPLYMVILGATKSQSSLHFAPFCLHGLTALNELMAKTQRLVPLSALLLRLLDMDLKAIEKASKGPDEAKEAVHIEMLLQLPNFEEETLSKVGNYICALFIDHLGLLSRSVAFPELTTPVLLHLRRHSKHCQVEALRRQLKLMISLVEESRQQVQRFREQLQEPPPPGQLFVLDATPLSRQRAQLLNRYAEHEKRCIEAETAQTREKRKCPKP